MAETWRKPLSWLLVVTFVTAIVLMARPPGAIGIGLSVLAIAGHLLVVTAALGRVWCAVYIGGRKNAELCSNGPYARVRNPLYFFSWLGVCGIMLVFRQPLLMLAASAAFALIYIPVVQSEERRLGSLFGRAYASYRARTPVFFPRLKGPLLSETREVRLRPVVRALTEVFWFLAAAIAGEALHTSGALARAHLALDRLF